MNAFSLSRATTTLAAGLFVLGLAACDSSADGPQTEEAAAAPAEAAAEVGTPGDEPARDADADRAVSSPAPTPATNVPGAVPSPRSSRSARPAVPESTPEAPLPDPHAGHDMGDLPDE